MQITEATVIKDNFGPDLVMLTTSLPSPMPNVTKQCANLHLNVAAGEGEKYLQSHFPGVKFKVIKP